MIVLKSKYDAMRDRANLNFLYGNEWKKKYDELLEKWNNLVEKINQKGGTAFLSGELNHPQFSLDEVKSLIQLCHPDKHEGKQSATEMTAKLLALKEKLS